MADASNKVVAGTQVTHASNAGALTAGSFSASTDIATALSGTGNMASYPRADVVLNATFSASIASTSTNVYLYRRDINIQSTNDETLPGASNKQHYVGTFQFPAATTVSTTHYVQLTDVPLPAPGDCEFYIENGLGVSLTSWALYVKPKTDTGATT